LVGPRANVEKPVGAMAKIGQHGGKDDKRGGGIA
jgi:hypothetical protein